MARWDARRWTAAVLGTFGVAILTGVPTVMVPNPWFSRMIDVTWWDRPVWVVTSVLAGLLVATYVAPSDGVASAEVTGSDGAGAPSGTSDDADASDELDVAGRRGGVGALLTFFAIGCPVCNKLVVLALGTSGATAWFAPAQPLLAAASIALLAFALRTRLATAEACPAPTVVRV
jgi:hypothetical protein